MIKGFKNKRLENYFIKGTKKGMNLQHIDKLGRVLDRLDHTSDVQKDMNYPGSDLHKLEPKDDDRWAVKIDKNWRITFVFRGGDAYEVDYVDYH